MDTKMVIVVRKDLNMRRGKEDAQCGHAASDWLITRIRSWFPRPPSFSREEMAWMNGNHRKVTVQVESEAELDAIYQKATEARLEVHLVVDAGLTEFGGVSTKTCLAIGPDLDEKIDPITGSLKLR